MWARACTLRFLSIIRGMARIGGYLNPEEHREFGDYSSSLCVTGSALVALLIARELRVKRLKDLVDQFRAGARVGIRKRISSPVLPNSLRDTFEDHAKTVGLSLDQAASILFRAELAERWLDRALCGTKPESD